MYPINEEEFTPSLQEIQDLDSSYNEVQGKKRFSKMQRGSFVKHESQEDMLKSMLLKGSDKRESKDDAMDRVVLQYTISPATDNEQQPTNLLKKLHPLALQKSKIKAEGVNTFYDSECNSLIDKITQVNKYSTDKSSTYSYDQDESSANNKHKTKTNNRKKPVFNMLKKS